jgi:hypothetical protein
MRTGLILITGLCATLAASRSSAAPVVNVGAFDLQPNTAGQVVEIRVTGTEQVNGVNFYAQIADAGPEPLVAGSAGDEPDITAVDLVGGGLLFAGGSQSDLGSEPQLAIYMADIDGTVPADGVLARLTVDTTGFFFGSGPFALRLKDTREGPTTFTLAADPFEVTPAITDGSIRIVPEPAGAAAACLAAAGIRRRRRRR